ncbi:MAG: hypothetical protein Kow00104_20980 [Rhodothalassiaceae bacterium]
MNPFARIVMYFCALVLPPLLAGCGGSDFRAEVTRFHGGDIVPPGGRTVRIEPLDPETDPIAFSHAAAALGTRLGRLGFAPAGDGAPDLIARLAIRFVPVETAPTEGASISIGGGSFGRSGGVSGALSFPVGERAPDRGYSREASLILIDAARDVRIFEGRAVSLGKTGDRAKVVPLLLDALFADFPGESGRMIEIRLPAPD